VSQSVKSATRVFKTAWFSKAAKKALVSDKELCEAIRQLLAGQSDDLGGGVFKKRLNRNMHRSIVLAKGRRYWIYVFLFAKRDRQNIGDDELIEFRKLAGLYAAKTDEDFTRELELKELLEICHGHETQVQD
jgi:hypothetical protein